MSVVWVILSVIFVIVIFIGIFYSVYYIFLAKEDYFEKHLQVGDMCTYYLNEYEYEFCTIIKINNDSVKIKDKYGKIYETNIKNIATP